MASFNIIFRDNAFIVADQSIANVLFHENGYGLLDSSGVLKLHPVEVLFLVDLGKAKVVDERGNTIAFKELCDLCERMDRFVWVKFLVYSDLRRRGYIVRVDLGEEPIFYVYRRGAKPSEEASRYVVYVLREGVRVSFTKIEQLVRWCQDLKKELILAIVDRQGEVVYYSLSSVIL